MLIQVREVEELNNRLHGILARHTGQPLDKIAKDTERDYFMSPEQAQTYGIIDEVYAERDQSLISEAKAGGGLAGEIPAAAVDEDGSTPAPEKGSR